MRGEHPGGAGRDGERELRRQVPVRETTNPVGAEQPSHLIFSSNLCDADNLAPSPPTLARTRGYARGCAFCPSRRRARLRHYGTGNDEGAHPE
ncbi:hypothetical protein GCM10017788_67230 [Amycolatopsis acidiphila]|nr:hypothetical protein GCM10017788_67230 [Amycolatopsis acidiphila]